MASSASAASTVARSGRTLVAANANAASVASHTRDTPVAATRSMSHRPSPRENRRMAAVSQAQLLPIHGEVARRPEGLGQGSLPSLVQGLIPSGAAAQRRRIAVLDDATIADDQHAVRDLDRRKTVRDDDCRAPAQQRAERALDQALRRQVKR